MTYYTCNCIITLVNYIILISSLLHLLVTIYLSMTNYTCNFIIIHCLMTILIDDILNVKIVYLLFIMNLVKSA